MFFTKNLFFALAVSCISLLSSCKSPPPEPLTLQHKQPVAIPAENSTAANSSGNSGASFLEPSFSPEEIAQQQSETGKVIEKLHGELVRENVQFSKLNHDNSIRQESGDPPQERTHNEGKEEDPLFSIINTLSQPLEKE